MNAKRRAASASPVAVNTRTETLVPQASPNLAWLSICERIRSEVPSPPRTRLQTRLRMKPFVANLDLRHGSLANIDAYQGHRKAGSVGPMAQIQAVNRLNSDIG